VKVHLYIFSAVALLIAFNSSAQEPPKVIILNGNKPIEYEQAPAVVSGGALLFGQGAGAGSLFPGASQSVFPLGPGFSGPFEYEAAFRTFATDSAYSGSKWVWSYGWQSETGELVFSNQTWGGTGAGQRLQNALRAQGYRVRYVPTKNPGTEALMNRARLSLKPVRPCAEPALVGGERIPLSRLTTISQKAPKGSGFGYQKFPGGYQWNPCNTHCQQYMGNGGWGSDTLRKVGLGEKLGVGEAMGWTLIAVAASDMAFQDVIENHPEDVNPQAAAIWPTFVHDSITLRPGHSPRKYGLDFIRMVEAAPDNAYQENRQKIHWYEHAARNTTWNPDLSSYYQRKANCYKDSNKAAIAMGLVKQPFKGLTPDEKTLYQAWASGLHGGEWPDCLARYRRKMRELDYEYGGSGWRR